MAVAAANHIEVFILKLFVDYAIYDRIQRATHSDQKGVRYVSLARKRPAPANVSMISISKMGVQHRLKNTAITNSVRATLISFTFTALCPSAARWKLMLWLRTVLKILR